jgi:hypothetical protein
MFTKVKNNIRIFLLIIILAQFFRGYSQNWPKIYGDNFDAYVNKVFEDYDHGYLIGGNVLANANTFRYAWIIKTDINGNELWNKKYGNGTDQYYLGSSAKTTDGGLIVCGNTTVEDTQFDPLFYKLNACREVEWCKILLSEGFNGATDVLSVEDGYIGILRYYGNDSLYSRISLIKMNQEGEPLWIQHLAQEDTLIYNEEGHALLLTSNNNYLITGRCFYPGLKPFWILTDTTGEQIWDLKWSNCTGTCFQSIEHHDGIFYSMGYSVPPGNTNYPTIYKYDASGYEISKTLLMGGDTISSSGGNSILKINDTSLLVGVVWLDYGFPNEIGHSEVFKIDTLGNLINRRLLLYEDTSPSILTLTADNKILVSGDYVVDNNWDIYLWKMNSDLEDDTLYTQPLTYDSLCPYEILSDTVDLDCSLFVNIDDIPTKELYESTIKISPNPAKDWITLTLPDNVSQGIMELAIYNIFGQEVMKTRAFIQNKTVSLNVSCLPSGIYLATCKDSKQRALNGKFLVSR